MIDEIWELDTKEEQSFEIGQEDWNAILEADDSVLKADELGYQIEPLLVTKIMIAKKPAQMRDARMLLRPYHGEDWDEYRNAMWAKVNELFPGHEAEQIAISVHLKKFNKRKIIRSWYLEERTLTEVKIPRFKRDLIRYSGLVECGNVEEIKEFKLSDNNERIRREVSFGTEGGY